MTSLSYTGVMSNSVETRTINLNTEVVISEADWEEAFGVSGRNAVEADVRAWARNLITQALAANGVTGTAQ